MIVKYSIYVREIIYVQNNINIRSKYEIKLTRQKETTNSKILFLNVPSSTNGHHLFEISSAPLFGIAVLN